MTQTLNTILIAPMTTTLRHYPSRIKTTFQGIRRDCLGSHAVLIVGLTGSIEYIRQDGVHPTSIFNLTLTLPAQLFP